MRSRRVHRNIGALLLVLVVALVAGSARAETIRVKIENLAFMPAQVAAHVGDTIEWTNADFVAHTATARNGTWDVMIPPAATATIVLKTDGMVEYYCKFHPNMTGQITIAK